MILTCNYEEVTALRHGAQSCLGDPGAPSSAVAAPSAARVAIEGLLESIDGGFSVETLSEQRELERALRLVVQHLREEVDARVLATHPADEGAVAAYFDFAHALAVLGRVMDMGEEMEALLELITGVPPGERNVREFRFPD